MTIMCFYHFLRKCRRISHKKFVFYRGLLRLNRWLERIQMYNNISSCLRSFLEFLYAQKLAGMILVTVSFARRKAAPPYDRFGWPEL